jgi:hypothetical protein
MNRLRFGILILGLTAATTARAQNQPPDLRTEAGCGPMTTQFDVKTDKNQHSVAQPDSGKALVYVIVEEKRDPQVMQIGDVTTRVGLDGNWVGANHGASYISFSVDPGAHRVCSDWQSKLKSIQKLSGAVDLTAEAGKTYFFRVQATMPYGKLAADLKLRAIDDAEGLLLISKSPSSTWKAKK